MTPIEIARLAAKLIVGTAVGTFTTRAVIANAPATRKFKTAEMTGALTGAVVATKLEPKTDKIVDDIFARIEASKKNPKIR